MYNWHAFFPHTTVRPQQEEAINFILNTFLTDKKRYCIAEIPTGGGKSAIAVTVARYLDDAFNNGNVFLTDDTKPGAYFITTQKLLQEQYINDFGGTCGPMRSVKSSSNFDCTFFTKQKCSESLRMVKHEKPGSPFFRACAIDCIYKAVKREFLEARESVTNFPYLLAESQYAKKITRRNLLVIDECLRENALVWINNDSEVTIKEVYDNPDITHVMSYNNSTDAYERKRITRKIRTEYDRKTQWVELTVEANNKTSQITVTSNHRIWTKNRGYVCAGELSTTDIVKFDTLTKRNVTKSLIKPRTSAKISATNKNVTIKSVRKLQTSRAFKDKKTHFKYNIEVEDNHNYFANSLLVSNCHNAESQLSKFVEVSFSERFSRTFLNIEIPDDIHTDRQVIGWIRNEYMPVLTKKTLSIGQLFIKYAGLKDKLDELGSFAKQYEKLDKHMCKVNRFLAMYDDTNWVMNITTTDRNSGKKIEFKPVDVAPYAEPTLFNLGDKILLMSATIMNKDSFCSSLGIDPAEAAFISMPSPFPKENRPVFFVPVGSMAMNSIDASLPALAQKIKEIIAIHKGEKGIIHAQTYRIASYIKKNVKSKRIILHDTENREEMLAKHISSPEPTILLSPSMTEGIDLKDDASRFQILCKVAYPYLGDPVIRKRMKKHAWWYAYATAKTMLQSMGRSVRNDTDHAVTYILDSDFNRFYSNNRNLFPADFDELLHRL